MDKPIHDIKPKKKPTVRKRTVAPVPPYSDTEVTLTPKAVKQTTKRSTSDESADVPRALILTLQFLAYAIPLGFLAYVLYINYLPFGYEKTFTIDVGAVGDTSVGEFYLEPSPDLSERKTAPDGTTYRELNGMANVIFKPNVVLKDAEITVSVEGEGVEIIPPVIDFNPDEYEWDYEWDFTQKETAFTPKVSERAQAEWKTCTTTEAVATTTEDIEIEEIDTDSASATSSTDSVAQVCEPAPVPDLVGNAFWFDNELTFNGRDTRLEMPGTADKFEEGPFTVYAEWTPTDNTKDFQQIVGHYNWEIIQNSDSISFQIGRVNDINGRFYSVIYDTKEKNGFSFKSNTYKVIAHYRPDYINGNGYISLYVNNEFAGLVLIDSDSIWTDYNESNNLSFGITKHGGSNFYKGSIKHIKISNSIGNAYSNSITLNLTKDIIPSIYLFSSSKSQLDSVDVYVSQ